MFLPEREKEDPRQKVPRAAKREEQPYPLSKEAKEKTTTIGGRSEQSTISSQKQRGEPDPYKTTGGKRR